MLRSMLLERIVKFVGVGVINTLIDFFFFNVLSSKKVGLGKVKANLISTTIAMTFSFTVNKEFVFAKGDGNYLLQALSFVAITAFGLYVLQNIVIVFLAEKWTKPADLAYSIVKKIGLGKLFSKDFVRKNSAKVAATAVSLTWNFIMYSLVVFKL